MFGWGLLLTHESLLFLLHLAVNYNQCINPGPLPFLLPLAGNDIQCIPPEPHPFLLPSPVSSQGNKSRPTDWSLLLASSHHAQVLSAGTAPWWRPPGRGQEAAATHSRWEGEGAMELPRQQQQQQQQEATSRLTQSQHQEHAWQVR